MRQSCSIGRDSDLAHHQGFLTAYNALPSNIRALARDSFELVEKDPFNSKLHFKWVHDVRPVWSVRVCYGYRAVGVRRTPAEIVWFWIGTHADYEKLLKRL